MKKNVFKWMAMLLVAIVSVGFVSCSGNDDDDVTGDTEKKEVSIVGTWRWQNGSNYYEVTITADGKYSVVGEVNGHRDTGAGTCSLKDGYLYLTGAAVDKVKVVSQTATQLVLNGWPEKGDCIWVKK